MPVMPSDKAMRLKHTAQSVDYNLSHFYDHASGLSTSLKKMATVNPKMAQMHRTQVLGHMDKISTKLKGTNMATTKKTGSFAGKSNKPGGGGRAAQLKAKGLSGGLIGFLGRRKYGASAMAKWSAAGRTRAK